MIPIFTMTLGSLWLASGIYFKDQHMITSANIYIATTLIIVSITPQG